VELASGVDALYLSGRAVLPAGLLNPLDEARAEAVRLRTRVPVLIGGEQFHVMWHGFHRYRYCIVHPNGRIGLTESKHLPAIWIQPDTKFLQGRGPRGAVQWFRDLLEGECGPVLLAVARLDLFGDFQGWCLAGDSRHEFVCRATSRLTYEDDEIFNGFIFGLRKTGTVLARIYDKTIESVEVGSGYWPMIWGDKFNPQQSVIRVEFEVNRQGLREYGLSDPNEVLDATGAVWADLTQGWLTHRTPSADRTKSRWSVSPEWEAVRRARVGENAFGINRMRLGQRRGSVANLMPALEGCLASFGAYAEASSLDELLPDLRHFLAQRERETGLSLGERIARQRQKFDLP